MPDWQFRGYLRLLDWLHPDQLLVYCNPSMWQRSGKKQPKLSWSDLDWTILGQCGLSMIIIQNVTTESVRFKNKVKPQGDIMPKQNTSPIYQAPEENRFSGGNQQ